MWLYYCLLSTVISGFTAIALKKCSQNEQKRMAIMGLFCYNFILFAVILVIKPQFIFQLNLENMLEMFLGVFLQSIGFFCAISSVKYGKVAITSSIKKCNAVIIFLLGIIVLKEDFSILQIIISALLVFLTIMIGRQENGETQMDKKLRRKSILYAYGYVICNGISKVLSKVYVIQFQDPLYVVFNYAIIAILGILIYCTFTKGWDYLNFKKINAKKYFLLQSLCDTSSSVFTRFAMLDGNVSVISVMETSSIVITILASRLILKEKITWQKYVMILGIFLCVLTLAIIK